MLIRFTVANFRSFYQETALSMYPSKVQAHTQQVLNTGCDIQVLQAALLYGANASGKSNLIKAMHFARQLIVQGTRPKQRIAVEPFKLDSAAHQQPSRFEFEFIVDGCAYAYGFSVDSQRVQEEWLYQRVSAGEKMLFERTTDSANTTRIQFDNLSLLNAKKDEAFLNFVARSTRPNQLFLHQAIEENVSYFEAMFSWFDKGLVIIFPESKISGMQILLQHDADFKTAITDFLKSMHTGIDNICLNLVEEPDNFLSELLPSIIENLTPNTLASFSLPTGHYLARLNETNQPEVYALSTTRLSASGETISFNLFEESDGTRRLFDLFPIVHADNNTVFVIDELERSLHPNLVYQFIEYVLQKQATRQLIVSTHEATLLDLALLRRDEIWFVEKHPAGHSTLYSLEEFKIRKDLDIQKGYLQGRFGAVPILSRSLPIVEQVR